MRRIMDNIPGSYFVNWETQFNSLMSLSSNDTPFLDRVIRKWNLRGYVGYVQTFDDVTNAHRLILGDAEGRRLKDADDLAKLKP